MNVYIGKSGDKVKIMIDGRAMLNLGCGTRTEWTWNNIDCSPYARLAHHRRFARFLHAVGILCDWRYKNLLCVDPDIICWDIRKGLPFKDNVFDVVYHSHFITHVHRDMAAYVTRECYRVLKPGGIIRVVTPDLLMIVHRYIKSVEELEEDQLIGQAEYEKAVFDLFELMVRRYPHGTNVQKRVVRMIEYLLRGNINRRVELRCWHYDRYSMGTMLREAGFRNVYQVGPSESQIQGWNQFYLDLNKDGSIYKRESLYMEGMK